MFSNFRNRKLPWFRLNIPIAKKVFERMVKTGQRYAGMTLFHVLLKSNADAFWRVRLQFPGKLFDPFDMNFGFVAHVDIDMFSSFDFPKECSGLPNPLAIVVPHAGA